MAQTESLCYKKKEKIFFRNGVRADREKEEGITVELEKVCI